MTFRGKSQKTDTEGGIAEKEGLGQFADLRGLGKKEGGGEVDTPMHTMHALVTQQTIT